MKDLRLEMLRSMADGDRSFEAQAHDLSSFGGHAVWFGLYFLNAFFTVLPRGVAKGGQRGKEASWGGGEAPWGGA